MSEYGSGVSLRQTFEYDRERIQEALQGRIMVDETEDGFVYDDCTKEEADEYILDAFDNAVYMCLQCAQSSRALERYMDDHGIQIDFRDYLKYMQEIEEEDRRHYEDEDGYGEEELEDD